MDAFVYDFIMRFLIIFSLLTFISSCSCSKEEPVYGATELWLIAKKFDPTIELVAIPNHESERRVVCENYEKYADGCVKGSGKRIKVRTVELLVIQFEKPEQARRAAKNLNQWYTRNWLLDEVTNEPVLEDFVQKALKAKAGRDVVLPEN